MVRLSQGHKALILLYFCPEKKSLVEKTFWKEVNWPTAHKSKIEWETTIDFFAVVFSAKRIICESVRNNRSRATNEIN